MDEKNRIEAVHEKVMQLIQITNDLEALYPEKSFKLDGILLGNIGEVLAAYHYGIRLFKQSEPTHDGEVTEIYNGTGNRVWEASRYVRQMNHYSISVPKLLQLREQIADEERIKQEHPVKQYVRIYKNNR